MGMSYPDHYRKNGFKEVYVKTQPDKQGHSKVIDVGFVLSEDRKEIRVITCTGVTHSKNGPEAQLKTFTINKKTSFIRRLN